MIIAPVSVLSKPLTLVLRAEITFLLVLLRTSSILSGLSLIITFSGNVAPESTILMKSSAVTDEILEVAVKEARVEL